MPRPILKTLILILLSASLTATADSNTAERESERMNTEAQATLEEAERARLEAEAARAEATKAAEMARQLAQSHQELIRHEAELAREQSEQQRGEREARAAARTRQAEEMERVREELSRAHRELREASREVAQAHRELARSAPGLAAVRRVNLGDRAVIGVVLGPESGDGVEIIGVSPDGPSERAGLQAGDVIVSLGGADLAGSDSARATISEVMANVSAGEELLIEARRDGETMEFAVTAERREPRVWQSMIRIPAVGDIEAMTTDTEMIIERIEIPEIDEAALTARVTELTERLKEREFVHVHPDGKQVHRYEFHVGDFSEIGEHLMDEADTWFDLPRAHGLELASIDESLGIYFDTERGVLVVKAREGNAYGLESGDVILAIGDTAVESPSDLLRALRHVNPGEEIELSIKRQHKDRTLKVIVPENRFGMR